MSDPAILNKIKLLLNLTKSSNVNEAENAQAMADKLIAKYNITEEDLKSIEDKKPAYGEEEKLFTTMGVVGWKQSLALTIAKQFYCQVIQEELVPLEGVHQFNYYVYGDTEDFQNVKFAFNAFNNRIEELVSLKCIGRGAIFISSYTEGLVEAINNNIMWEGIDIPELKRPSKSVPKKEDNVSKTSLTKEEKEKPMQETVSAAGKTMIKDIAAYFKGLADGKDFSLKDVLELASKFEESKQISNGEETPT